tara:strand:+ start:16 stop:147 length:132 start_codon:yes stop_codon:yes gene_type:complete
MFTYFNDEWNGEENKDEDTNLPRMARCAKGTSTGEEQKEVQPK